MDAVAMLAAYQRERQGAELEIEPGKGFATWKLLFDPAQASTQDIACAQQGIAVVVAPVRDVYLVDIYVNPDHRRTGLASLLADRIAQKAKAKGATRMIGTVDVRNHTRTDAIKAILASGFSFDRVDGDFLVFTRGIS